MDILYLTDYVTGSNGTTSSNDATGSNGATSSNNANDASISAVLNERLSWKIIEWEMNPGGKHFEYDDCFVTVQFYLPFSENTTFGVRHTIYPSDALEYRWRNTFQTEVTGTNVVRLQVASWDFTPLSITEEPPHLSYGDMSYVEFALVVTDGPHTTWYNNEGKNYIIVVDGS